MTKAVHAEEIALYAEDCQKYEEPWLLWQERSSFNTKEWNNCTKHLTWESNKVYRRKPARVKIGEVVVDGPVLAAIDGQEVFGLFHGNDPFYYNINFKDELEAGVLFSSRVTKNEYKKALMELIKTFEKVE